ncbi:TATA box-binding protein-like 1 [Nilaparvata lugens]|uniref:TATA box-binding protein-like 1 n=1 Tax=Nilaparvata lugens TaxID=108931 RepID=UPI00193D0F58|nr:TATA box-binding protein-like 1 [Nilaparvata lugens]
MAAVVQKNGMKPHVNGGLAHPHPHTTHHTHDHRVGVGVGVSDAYPLRGGSGCDVINSDVFIKQEVKQEDEDCDRVAGDDEPEIDIVINNVVCSFSVRCHLNLRQIALNGVNVEYRRENGMVTMKLRKPYTTASIWSSGKITCTGATSEEQSHVAARRFARLLQRLGFNTRFTNYRIVNVLGTCSMPFAIKINAFSEKHKPIAEYEPELHPGVTYKLKKPKATLKIFSTGSITVTAPSVLDVQQAIEHIYPLVLEFRKERSKEDEQLAEKRRGAANARKRTYSQMASTNKETDDEDDDDDDDDNDCVAAGDAWP